MVGMIVVGIGEYAVVKGDTPISMVGLGSCVGIVLYDKIKKIYGMSHVMLPEMDDKNDRIGKYADTAIPALIDEMVKKGADRNNIRAKIAGGANIFTFEDNQLQIGHRNIEAIRNILKQYNIPIDGEDVGGNLGRTIIFHPEDCTLSIRMIRKNSNELIEKII